MQDSPKSGLRIVACGCKSQFCNNCASGIGWKIRQRLLLAMTRWSAEQPVMVTLTIDPKNFRDPHEAQSYVKQNRCIGRLMRALRKKLGFKWWFAVIEWQENGWPHWHVLIDSEFVPYELLNTAWQRLGPNRTGSTKPMGIVWISKGSNGRQGKFLNKQHAAFYATKYLTKPPKDGYPAWLLAAEDLFFKRYQAAQGMWTDPDLKAWEEAAALARHWEEKGYPPEWEETEQEEQKARGRYKRNGRTIQARIDQCGRRAVVISWHEVVRKDGEIISRRAFRFQLNVRFVEAMQLLKRAEWGKYVTISNKEYEALKELATGEPTREHFARRLRESQPVKQRKLFAELAESI